MLQPSGNTAYFTLVTLAPNCSDQCFKWFAMHWP